MPLILRAISLNDVPLTQSIEARFDGPGTIGRADQNTMALPDPERHISRRQAEVGVAAGGYAIRNVGAANPIVVRGQRLMQGESAALASHDEIRIGGYLLEVVEAGAAEGETRRMPERDAPPASRGDPFDPPRAELPLGDFNTPLSKGNPFADLLAPQARGSSAPAGARLPDDFDPFASVPVAAPVPSGPAASFSGGVFGDLLSAGAPSSIDALFGLDHSTKHDPLADFVEAPVDPLGAAGPAPASVDPFAMFGQPDRATPGAAGSTLPDDVPELRGAFRPPRPMPSASLAPAATEAAAMPTAAMPTDAVPTAAPPAAVMPFAATPTAPRVSQARTPSAAPASSTSDPASLWAAFCEGAGLDRERARGLDADAMRTIGAVLAAAVDGTMQLIAVRSATRHELHAQVTVIRPRDNNPLKFSPDAQSALEQLLAPPLRGFLPAPAAMSDAMHDLVGHAIGTMAGVRAALEGVLGRFAPEELERKLASRSVLDSVLPMNRKAKLWELYLQHYEAIRDEAQEDFHALFGRAFLDAYEQQLERLRREAGPAAGR